MRKIAKSQVRIAGTPRRAAQNFLSSGLDKIPKAAVQWGSSSNANWITVTSGSSGNGPGTITFAVGSNLGAARTGTISAANQQFTVSQSPYVNANITLQFTNTLIYPANVFVNGTVVGSVNASSATSFTIPASVTFQVSFELVRPTLQGVALGDPMIGYYNTFNNPVGSYSFKINNQIGNQQYFAPLITNTSGSPLLMDVNRGLQAENRCNCVIPPGGVNVGFGYYRLFSNSNVQAFRDGSDYFGASYYFENFSSLVENQLGVLRRTFSNSP